MRKSLFALALASVLGTGLASSAAAPTTSKSDGFHFTLFGQTYCVGSVQSDVSCDRRYSSGPSRTTSEAAMPASESGNPLRKLIQSFKSAAAKASSGQSTNVQ